MRVKSLQLCLTLGDPMDCSPPGSSVHRILQARILKWVAMPFSRISVHTHTHTHTHRTESLCCIPETIQHCKSTIFQLKKCYCWKFKEI